MIDLSNYRYLMATVRTIIRVENTYEPKSGRENSKVLFFLVLNFETIPRRSKT